MTSEVSICNQALGFLGEGLITSFSDGTKGANLCQANYQYLRDAVLEDTEWSFAMKRDKLPALSTTPVSYAYAHQLPTDCLRVCQVSWDNQFIQTDTLKWELEDRKVLCDLETVYVRYVSRVTDPSKFSPGFTQALVYRIASELAIPLTNSRSLMESMQTMYEARLRVGVALDGTQGRTRRVSASWINRAR